MRLILFYEVFLLNLFQNVKVLAENAVDFWNIERPQEMANIKSLEVMCGKTFMEVQISFDRPFNGIIFSKGAVNQYNCIYVKPQTGSITYSFNILYNKCGTKPDMNGKFYENNIVIQYDKDLIEVWDEAKRLRCEWYNDYEKGITKPPIRVSDIEVVELNFRGDNVDCWMEIQHGKGPWASLVSGIVPLGTTLTMVVGIKDRQGEFDMRVKSCSAEAERTKPIHLSDENGCVLRPKMISRFMKISGADHRASVMTYAFFHAFKFPDSMSVNIKCKVEICRFGCPEHCQKPDKYMARETDVSVTLTIPKNNQGPRFEAQQKKIIHQNAATIRNQKLIKNYIPSFHQTQPKNKIMTFSSLKHKLFSSRNNTKVEDLNFFGIKLPAITNLASIFTQVKEKNEPKLNNYTSKSKNQLFEYSPVRSTLENSFPYGPRKLKMSRNKRSLEEMGVVSGYKVISEVDLAFKPSLEKGVGITVFQGKIVPEEVVLGVCIPATGFSALFVLLSLLTVVAIIISAFICYHRGIQKKIDKAGAKFHIRPNEHHKISNLIEICQR